MHSGPGAQSSFCEYTTQGRQLSYTLLPCTIIAEDKWAIPNSVSECVMGWLMSWRGTVTAWESLMRCLPWPRPQLVEWSLVSEHHSASLTRHTPTRSTGQCTAPQGRIQGRVHLSLSFSYPYTTPSFTHASWEGWWAKLHGTGATYITRGRFPLVLMDRVAADRHNECFRWRGKCAASLSRSCQKSPGSANGATAAVALPLFLAKSHDPLHKPIFLALKNSKLRHRKHNEALLRLTTQTQTQIRPEICSADSRAPSDHCTQLPNKSC